MPKTALEICILTEPVICLWIIPVKLNLNEVVPVADIQLLEYLFLGVCSRRHGALKLEESKLHSMNFLR